MIIKDPEQLMWWTWEKIIRNMYKLQEGSQYAPELKEIDIIEFVLPDDLVYKKLKNKTLLKRIEKEIRSVYDKENFYFKVLLTTGREEIIIE